MEELACRIKRSCSPQQQNICVSSRTLKHLVTDVPDPPEDSGSACRICEDLAHHVQKAERKSRVLTSPKTSSSWDKTSLVLLCLSSFLPISVCDHHMLRYYHTGWYYPEEGRYHFETVGYVDDREIDMYSIKSHVNIPKTAWMEEKEGSDYWEKETSLRKGWENVFRDNLMILASRFNYTRSFHTLQLSYGCELHDDGISTGCYQYGFDGKDFLVFDINTLLWIPAMQKAEISAQRWNSDRIIAKGVKLYIMEHCTSALRKYIGYGREDLEKRVRPDVKVWGHRQHDGVMRLQCLVYGFHPRAVHVKWVRNGVDDVPSDEISPILPHPDGTYQIRVSAEVPETEGDTYSCHVDHSSLEEPLVVFWDPESDNVVMVSIIVVVVTGVILLTILATGALVLIKKSAKYYKAVLVNAM